MFRLLPTDGPDMSKKAPEINFNLTERKGKICEMCRPTWPLSSPILSRLPCPEDLRHAPSSAKNLKMEAADFYEALVPMLLDGVLLN
jgi:hypothetical protein